MKKVLSLAMVLALAFTVSVAHGEETKKKPKVDPKIYKLANPLKNAKVGDFANYNVILKSPMSPEPMKSKLTTNVIAATKNTVTVRFRTNLMGQTRVEKQVIPRNTPLIKAILLILKRQFRLKVKIHSAKLADVKAVYNGKKQPCKLIDAKVSGIGASGQKGKNHMKVWIHKDITVFGFLRAKIETEWRLGDTALKLEFTMDLAEHSGQKKKKETGSGS